MDGAHSANKPKGTEQLENHIEILEVGGVEIRKW